MDVYEAIRDLRKERDRLDATIAALEARVKWERQQKSGKGKGRRGRKTMSPEERLQVSERMRRYWAARRRYATS
jgi:hypothetical protein